MNGDHRILIPIKILVFGMVIFGSQAAVPVVWDMADAALGLMAIVNLAAILLLARIATMVIRDYERQLDLGEDPVFDRNDFPELAARLADDVWQADDRARESPP